MNVSRRFVLLGTACAAVVGAVMTTTPVLAGSAVGSDAESKALLLRMVRVMYPHANFSDAPYQRSCEAILGAANKSIGQAVMFGQGMAELKAAGFAEMDDAGALAHLKSIEGTDFFQLARGTVIVSLYNDAEVWETLGYEGPSFDQGGYLNRGFNDLDWLPDPRITEL
ncbi:MAG: hypothetical protein AAGC57_21120 [Pseudomonadota bacterium]